jgi:signal transduction histidine kinase
VNFSIRHFFHHRSLFQVVQDIRRLRRSDIFLLISIICLAAYIFLTQSMLGKLQKSMTGWGELYAVRIARQLDTDIRSPAAFAMISNIIGAADIPTIVIDSGGMPVAWAHTAPCAGIGERALIRGTSAWLLEREQVREKAGQLRKKAGVSAIMSADDRTVLGYVVIGHSGTIRNLLLLSIAMTILLTCFALIMYISFQNFRLNERSNLWVALAKETAHQLGTPITALMGWVEYLRSSNDKESGKHPEEIIGEIDKICADMDNDLKRLCKISSRFSQIGSVPVLTPCNINEILQDCMDYFQVRLPLTRRKIEMRPQFSSIPLVYVNRELVEWVFENLLKNSIDAIQKEIGRIEIRTEYREHEKIVRIYHADNGRGITWEAHKKVFSPGFSTKKRGWGLGLTLAKRIIEDYHQGMIYVHWSKKDKGTVFCVDLPINAKAEQSRTLNV